jgi:hypothetical protein
MVGGVRGNDGKHEESESRENEVLKSEGENIGRIGVAEIEEPSCGDDLKEVHLVEFIGVGEARKEKN